MAAHQPGAVAQQPPCQKAADDTTTEPASAESDAAENGSADSNEKKEGLLYAVSSDGSEDKTTVFSFMGAGLD